MSLHWEDKQTDTQPPKVPEDIVDLVFRVRCPSLPIDHAKELYQAVAQSLPWIKDNPVIGIHTLHGAESGNGWVRPDEGGIIHLSKRTRFIIRLPVERVKEARALEHQLLRTSGCDLQLGPSRVRLLSRETTLFARHIAFASALDEEAFLDQVAAMLKQQNITSLRIMTGRRHTITGMAGKLICRSLMIDGLSFDDSIHLQQYGLGEHKVIGCGIFLPHKSIAAVYQPTQ